MQWLEDDFLSYLHNWENSVRKHKDLAKAEQHMMLLSAETRLGLEITGNYACRAHVDMF